MGFWNHSLCVLMLTVFLSLAPFPRSPITAAASPFKNLNQRAAYSFIYGHPCILAIQTHADTQIFTGLYGSAVHLFIATGKQTPSVNEQTL